LEDRYLRRAGLDYWSFLDVTVHDSLEALQRRFAACRFLYASTHADRRYTDVSYAEGDFLVFGKEATGLPAQLLEANAEHSITIPIIDRARSLNLANAVAVVVFEAYRQLDYPYLSS
jgi:tRNA (cytidine/uridine-2'-O-)-methyltransferase